jgi:hypothetical protein
MAITYTKRLGAANKNTGSATTHTLTTTGGASAAGASIVVAIVLRASATVDAVADSAGNVYQVDIQAVNGSSCRVAIASCHNALALPNGTVVTATFSAALTTASMVADEFANPTLGLSSVGADRTASGTGASTAPATSATGATTTATQLVYGAVGVQIDATGAIPTMTAGAGYTRTTEDATASASSRVGVYPEHKVVAATGTQVADGTLSVSKTWAAVVATYREPASFGHRASAVVAEVARVVDTGRSASLVAAEVAYGAIHAGASFVGAEVAYTAPAVAATARRPTPQVIG